jgi:hypothetical protein
VLLSNKYLRNYIGGREGHASEPEKISPRRKEAENDPDTIPFIPKGAFIHTKNRYPKPAVQ